MTRKQYSNFDALLYSIANGIAMYAAVLGQSELKV